MDLSDDDFVQGENGEVCPPVVSEVEASKAGGVVHHHHSASSPSSASRVIFVDGTPYEVYQRLGQGTYGAVYLGRHIESGTLVAVKAVKGEDARHLQRELNALVAVGRNDHVVSLRAYDPVVKFPSDDGLSIKDKAVFVLDLAPHGELFSYVLHTGPFSEQTARVLFQQLVLGLFHCHSRGVFHRDIKAENVLLDESYHVRLADFGFAVQAHTDEMLKTTLGSELYMSPEVRGRRAYRGAPADVWAIGVLLFVLLTKSYPFPRAHGAWYWARVKAQQYDSFWKAHFRTIPHLSPGVVDLLNRIFVFDPSHRITLPQLISHPWMREGPLLSREAYESEMRTRHGAVLDASADSKLPVVAGGVGSAGAVGAAGVAAAAAMARTAGATAVGGVPAASTPSMIPKSLPVAATASYNTASGSYASTVMDGTPLSWGSGSVQHHNDLAVNNKRPRSMPEGGGAGARAGGEAPPVQPPTATVPSAAVPTATPTNESCFRPSHLIPSSCGVGVAARAVDNDVAHGDAAMPFNHAGVSCESGGDDNPRLARRVRLNDAAGQVDAAEEDNDRIAMMYRHCIASLDNPTALAPLSADHNPSPAA